MAWSLSPGHLDSLPALYSVAFSDDGTRFAVGGNDGTVRWWEFNGDKTPQVWDRGNPIKGAKGRINAVLFQPGDSSILAAAGLEGNVRFWSLKQDFFNEPLVLQARTPIESLALHHDGNLVVAGDGRGQLHLWDLDVADAACRVALRNLTCQEWLENVGQKPYQPICPKLGYPACEGSAEAVGDLGYSITP